MVADSAHIAGLLRQLGSTKHQPAGACCRLKDSYGPTTRASGAAGVPFWGGRAGCDHRDAIHVRSTAARAPYRRSPAMQVAASPQEGPAGGGQYAGPPRLLSMNLLGPTIPRRPEHAIMCLISCRQRLFLSL